MTLILTLLDYVVELTSIQCSRLQPQSPPRYGSGTGSIPFPQAPAGARRILGRWQRSVLGLFRRVGRRRVLLPHPESVTGYLITPGDHHTLQHIQVHFGVDFQADFESIRWHDATLTSNPTKDHNRCRKLCFHHPRHVPVIRGNPDLDFEGAGNGHKFDR